MKNFGNIKITRKIIGVLYESIGFLKLKGPIIIHATFQKCRNFPDGFFDKKLNLDLPLPVHQRKFQKCQEHI